jgi:hypothetical protein
MRPSAYICHHIPGRMRVKIRNGTSAQLDDFRKRVSALPGVQNVETNPTTGSVLIVYSQNKRQDFVQRLSERFADLVSLAPESRKKIGDYSMIATHLLKQIKQADDELRVLSDGQADLKLLFPIAIVGLALTTLPTNLQTPLWLSFLMFGFSSFESMHTGALEQPAGKSGEQEESDASSGASQG